MTQLEKHQIPYIMPNAGFYVLINLSAWLDSDATEHDELDLHSDLWGVGVYLTPGQVRIIFSWRFLSVS